MILPCVVVFALAPMQVAGAEDFETWQGDVTQEAAWFAAAGCVGNREENFDSFEGVPDISVGGDPLTALPWLNVYFDAPVPGVYVDDRFAHSGKQQWCNWAGGAGHASDHVLRPSDGYAITALGFWQADPDGDQPMHAYDFDGLFVGTIIGPRNIHVNDPESSVSFAGFITSVPIAYIEIPGALGDGWNHIDDLQIVTMRRLP